MLNRPLIDTQMNKQTDEGYSRSLFPVKRSEWHLLKYNGKELVLLTPLSGKLGPHSTLICCWHHSVHKWAKQNSDVLMTSGLKLGPAEH
jgi:hypothetical protein